MQRDEPADAKEVEVGRPHSEFSRLDQAEVVEWHADDGHAQPGGAPEVLHYVRHQTRESCLPLIGII